MIKSVYRGVKTSDGAGVSLTRIIGSPDINMFDPFLLLDEFGSDNPNDYIGGFLAGYVFIIMTATLFAKTNTKENYYKLETFK